VTAANPGATGVGSPGQGDGGTGTAVSPTAGGAGPAATSPWSSLPDDLKDNPALTRHADVASLAKEYVNLQSVVGRKGIVLPKEGDAADEARFWKEMGRPEKAEEYGVSDIPVPEGLPWDTDFATAMLTEMHGANLTKAQARKVYESYLKLDADRWSKHLVVQEQAAGQTAQALRKEWGVAYGQNIGLAGKTYASIFGEDFQDIDQITLADGRRLGDDPRFLKAMLKVGRKLGEDSLLVSGGTSSAKVYSPEEAEKAYNELLGDEDFKKDLYNKERPGHEAAVQRQDALFRQMHPSTREGA
jgi:hypothetical protein